MFVDKVNLVLKAGDGGNGSLSFRREKFIDRGGPDGGDGGNGGNVVIVASRNQNTLATYRYKRNLKAENGSAGSKRRRHGKNGADLEMIVPPGTIVTANNGDILADLTQDSQRVILLRGGKGGFGNAHFVSSTRQAPRIAEKGEVGEAAEVSLELKMIADVGLVGLPNVGKSTLLSVVSNAKPEIADYAFTTLQPNLGVVDTNSGHSLLFADIPGLIEGASQGKGLGDEFLRHVERTSVLIHLIDAYSQDITSDYKVIMDELAAYKIDISTRPQIIGLSKVDGLDKQWVKSQLVKLKQVVPKSVGILAISSSSKEGIKELLKETQILVEVNRKKAAKKAKSELPVIGPRDDPDMWHVQKERDGFIVTGRKIESFARRVDPEDYHAQQRLRDIMKKMGITKELERQNIKPGQKIYIGEPSVGELEY